jgi:Calcineurin-like phosphoesterase
VRVVFTSDLHVDVTPQNGAILPYLVSRVQQLQPDVFILAGDVGNCLYQIDHALTAFDTLSCTRLFVPGNHDLWTESRRAVRNGKDSGFKHDEALPAICRKHDVVYLPGNPAVIDGVGFVGSVGWYDFSFRPRDLDAIYDVADYERGELSDPQYRTGVWNDCREVAWLAHRNAADWRLRSRKVDTLALFEELFGRFVSDLAVVRPSMEKLFTVLHTNPFIECLGDRNPPDPFDAYAGATRLGEKLARVATEVPTICICGHRHDPLDIIVKNVRVLRSPLGYLDGFQGDLEERAAQCVRLFET